MHRRIRPLFAVVAASLIVMLASPSAFAQIDQTPPTLMVDRTPSFVVGTVVERDFGWSDEHEYTWGIRQRLAWSAIDDRGPVWYSLEELWGFGFVFERSLETTEHLNVDGDYDGSFGCGACDTWGFRLTAEDAAGNATTKYINQSIKVVQESGSGLYQMAYSGTWATTTCECFLRGEARSTSMPGASVAFTRTWAEQTHVALVMATGPEFGRAEIAVDGQPVATIDTFAPTNQNRVVVYQQAMSAGEHSLTITNLATTGRPRIDLDAVMLQGSIEDQTPPELTVDVKPSFVVGTTVDPYTDWPVEATVRYPYTTNIQQRFAWSASSDEGTYGLEEVAEGGQILARLAVDETYYVDLDASDYDGDLGCGQCPTKGFKVSAIASWRGGVTTIFIPERVFVTQENNHTERGGGGPTQMVYSGTWATATCDCFLWRQARRTSTRRATVAFTRTWDEQDHLALVMPTGPNRGRARILVDGEVVATIDTFSPTRRNRVVVYQQAISAGEHTVTLRNLATRGRPVIALDAIMWQHEQQPDSDL